MGKRSIIGACASAVILLGTLSGCSSARSSEAASPTAPIGSSTKPASAIAFTRLPAAARELTFLFVPATTDVASRDASEGIRDGLLRAGFTLVAEPDRAHDARLEVTLQRSPVPDAWDETYLQVSLALYRGDDVVEWIVAPVGDPSSTERLGGLVERLVASPTIGALATVLARERSAARSMVASPTAQEPVDARSLDDAAWNLAAVRQCRNGRTPTACDKIETYLSNFPEGLHVADARAILALSRSKPRAR